MELADEPAALKRTDDSETQRNVFQSMNQDIVMYAKKSDTNGPRYETIDLRHSETVFRTKFVLDDTWSVERGQASFTSKEGKFVITRVRKMNVLYICNFSTRHHDNS